MRVVNAGEINDVWLFAHVSDEGEIAILSPREAREDYDWGDCIVVRYDGGIFPGTMEEWENSIISSVTEEMLTNWVSVPEMDDVVSAWADSDIEDADEA
jgi:hypothetical protein